MAVDFFHENWFLYKGRNDVTISHTQEFRIPVYLCLFVCSFAVKLASVLSLLAIVFAIKVQCQFHPHAFYQSLMEIVPHLQREFVVLEGNLTSFHFISSFKACFTNLECFL